MDVFRFFSLKTLASLEVTSELTEHVMPTLYLLSDYLKKKKKRNNTDSLQEAAEQPFVHILLKPYYWEFMIRQFTIQLNQPFN